MAKDAFLIERQAPRRREISGKAWARRNAIVQRHHTRILGFYFRHPTRKGVAQAGDHLEHRQVDVGNRLAEEITAAFRSALEDSLEVIEELWQAGVFEVSGALLRFTLLVFVVEAARDRMMRVVNFADPVGDGELKPMRPQTARFVLGHEAEAWAEKQQNVGGLRDHQFAGF